MANTIRISSLDKMPGYMEFDYKNPSADRRVRRKIKATNCQAELLKDLLGTVLDQRLDKDDTLKLIRSNVFYSPEASFLEEAVNLIYFNYCDHQPINALEHINAKNDLLHNIFPLNYDANFCFLGKAGVGKSTIIRKISCFWNNKHIDFPFTDTSRTSTFPADYCFVPKKDDFHFLAILKPVSILDLNISECIQRAINKLIDLTLNPNDTLTVIDEVFNAFISDPAQSFDIRYSLGRYIKTTSPAYHKEGHQKLISFWHSIFLQLKEIVDHITKKQVDQEANTLYYQLLYSDAIKLKDPDNTIYRLYKNVADQIKQQVNNTCRMILEELNNNTSIKNISYDLNDELIPYFSCTIKNIDCDDFYSFIKIFTTKKHTQFGHSLFNLVNHLRIELPVNPNITLPQKGFSFVVQDTIGIAHSNDGNGGFENSTNLKIEDVDAVVLIDDSRLNGDNNISNILQHIASRISPNNIYFAFTFFDDLSKEDFEEDEDLNEQRKNYLQTTESNTINNVIQNKKQAQILINKLYKKETFFLSGLMSPDNFATTEAMLEVLISNKLKSKNNLHLYKLDPSKKILVYDYKKIPLLYQKAVDNYTKQQFDIYFSSNPPHHKTTEALTHRLSVGITHFEGARKLHPVDDCYDSITKALSTYIDNPDEINLRTDKDNTIIDIIGAIKAQVTETLRNEINSRFLNAKALAEWDRLYNLSGTGSDLKRREGIINAENNIMPSIESYIDSTIKNHLINTLVRSLETAVDDISSKLHLN